MFIGRYVANHTNFISNKAKYFSNCIQFEGTLIAIDRTHSLFYIFLKIYQFYCFSLKLVLESLFSGNQGYVSDLTVDTEGIGGAIYLVAENVTLVNTQFIRNRAYFAGCIYINMNNQKNYLNFLGFNLSFISNMADNTGGTILFDADIMSAQIKIAYSVFMGNNATDCTLNFFGGPFIVFIDGGAISTKFASLTTTITFAYCMFKGNLAQFGGVMDLEHVIGTVQVAYSNLTQNLASNSDNSSCLIFLYPKRFPRLFRWLWRRNLHLRPFDFLRHSYEKLHLQQRGPVQRRRAFLSFRERDPR